MFLFVFSHPTDLVGPGHLGILCDLGDHALVGFKVDCNLGEVLKIEYFRF